MTKGGGGASVWSAGGFLQLRVFPSLPWRSVQKGIRFFSAGCAPWRMEKEKKKLLVFVSRVTRKSPSAEGIKTVPPAGLSNRTGEKYDLIASTTARNENLLEETTTRCPIGFCGSCSPAMSWKLRNPSTRCRTGPTRITTPTASAAPPGRRSTIGSIC
uniref:(northern house mosquito) hypothetical protein n=1 Tax=Culex pipiens TaxID=7175 RepID=A0A8D8HTW6_CULPI